MKVSRAKCTRGTVRHERIPLLNPEAAALLRLRGRSASLLKKVVEVKSCLDRSGERMLKVARVKNGRPSREHDPEMTPPAPPSFSPMRADRAVRTMMPPSPAALPSPRPMAPPPISPSMAVTPPASPSRRGAPPPAVVRPPPSPVPVMRFPSAGTTPPPPRIIRGGAAAMEPSDEYAAASRKAGKSMQGLGCSCGDGTASLGCCGYR